eukprot:904646-Prorocentrum_minimum.AAC.1
MTGRSCVPAVRQPCASRAPAVRQPCMTRSFFGRKPTLQGGRSVRARRGGAPLATTGGGPRKQHRWQARADRVLAEEHHAHQGRAPVVSLASGARERPRTPDNKGGMRRPREGGLLQGSVCRPRGRQVPSQLPGAEPRAAL